MGDVVKMVGRAQDKLSLVEEIALISKLDIIYVIFYLN